MREGPGSQLPAAQDVSSRNRYRGSNGVESEERRWSSSRSSKCYASGYWLCVDKTTTIITMSTNCGISPVRPFVKAARRERKSFHSVAWDTRGRDGVGLSAIFWPSDSDSSSAMWQLFCSPTFSLPRIHSIQPSLLRLNLGFVPHSTTTWRRRVVLFCR